MQSIPMMIKAIQNEAYPDENSAWCYLKMAVSNLNNPKYNEMFAQLILGELDGKIRDFRHLYEFYALTNKVEEAAKTSMIIADQELKSGKPREAHRAVTDAIRLLRNVKETVPNEMWDRFNILHTSTLLRVQRSVDNYMVAAQMAMRLRTNLEIFPPRKIKLFLS
jgi:hypothetical protein